MRFYFFRRSQFKQPGPGAVRRRWRTLLGQRRGVVALEFALTLFPLLALLLGVMEVGYDLYVQSALDYAVDVAARSVQTGAIKGSNGESSAQFATAAVCAQLLTLMTCNNLIVGVAPIPKGYDYYTAPPVVTLAKAVSSAGNICTGTGGQLILLQAWYLGPTFLGNLIPNFATTYNGELVHFTTASAGFVNEYFSGGQTTGSGC